MYWSLWGPLEEDPAYQSQFHAENCEEAAAVNILCEAIQHMAQTSPIPHDLINIITTGFPDADLPGLATVDIIELLGVSKSTVSWAWKDPHNIVMQLKYPPGVKSSRIENEQYEVIDMTLDQFFLTISGSPPCQAHK